MEGYAGKEGRRAFMRIGVGCKVLAHQWHVLELVPID